MSKSVPAARWALVSLSLSMVMPSLDAGIANAGLPALAAAFNASFRDVQWIVLSYLVAVTTLIVGAGRLGDVVGRRRLLLAGIVVFTLASLACAAAPRLWTLLAARVAQGAGAAVLLVLSVALVGDAVPAAKTGSAMGWLGTMSASGTALGPSLGGILIAALGWRSIFLVNVPVGVLAFVLAYRYVPRDRPRTSAAHAASPLVPVALFRDRALAAALSMSALVSTVMMTTLVVGPFYLDRALGLSAAAVGFVLTAGPLAAALAGAPAGRLVDRFGAERLTIAGLAGIAGGASIVVALPMRFGVIGYITPIVIMTISYAVFQTANNTAVMSVTRADQRGAIAGMLALARNLGLITGASAMGAVFAWASASSDVVTAHPAAIAAGMRFTFAVAAALILVALSIALAVRAHTTRHSTVNRP